jgi:multidrug efflux pump subunit AcrA (membrane-fusion protein)
LFIRNWGGTGFVLFTTLALFIFNRLLRTSGMKVAEVWRERKRIWMKPKRLIAYCVVIAVVVLVAIFVKIDQTAGGPARLIAAESFIITRIAPGLLETAYYKGGVLEKNNSQIFHLSAYDYSVTRIEPEVAVGDTVATGDTLLIINSMLNQGLLAEARSDLQRARADRRLLLSDPKIEEIATSKSEVSEAEAVYEKARKEFNRTKELYSRKLISEDEYERVAAGFNVSHSAWTSRKSELDLLRSGPKAEEIDKVDAEISKLESRVSYLEEQYEASVIVCPFDGVLVGATSGQDLLHLARTDSLIVEVKLNESDLDILSPGSKLELRVSAYPGQPHYGEVIKLKLSPELTAVAAIENNGSRLLPEMTGYAKVDCGSASLANLSARKVMRFFRLEFWSWF